MPLINISRSGLMPRQEQGECRSSLHWRPSPESRSAGQASKRANERQNKQAENLLLTWARPPSSDRALDSWPCVIARRMGDARIKIRESEKEWERGRESRPRSGFVIVMRLMFCCCWEPSSNNNISLLSQRSQLRRDHDWAGAQVISAPS